jgi:hypothetical protein
MEPAAVIDWLRSVDDCFHSPESAAARSLLSSASMSCTLPEYAAWVGLQVEQGAEPRGGSE